MNTAKPSVRHDHRRERLMPGGIPRWIRCYDNGGESADRYTVCYTGRAGTTHTPGYPPEANYRAMSANPRHPQGVGLFCGSKWRHCDVSEHGWPPAMGRKCHLGKRIPFSELPPDCQSLVIDDYAELWNLNT